MDIFASLSNALSSITTTVRQKVAVAKEGFHAVTNTVRTGIHEVVDHVSPRKRRRSSASIAPSPTTSTPLASAASSHPSTQIPLQPQAKRPRLADPLSESSHFPSPFLPPRIPLSSETPPRSRTPQSHPDTRIEAAVTYGLATTPRPSYSSTPARNRSHVHALDAQQQFFRRSYAALSARKHMSEPTSSSTKLTSRATHSTSVRKSVYKRRRNSQRHFASPKVLASRTRLLPLQQRPYPQPYRSHKTSPERRSKHQASQLSIDNNSQPKSSPKDEALETLPSPTMRAEQIAKLPPAISSLLRSDSLLSHKLWKAHPERITRLAASEQQKRLLEIQHFVKSQQLESLKRAREQSRRATGFRTQLKHSVEKTTQKLQPEQPPHRAAHFYESQYWLPPEEDGYGHQDDHALSDRDASRTVTDPNSAFAPLTKSAVARLRATFADASNHHSELSRVDGCIIRGEDLRTLRPNNWLNDEIVNAYMSLIAERATIARKKKSDENAKPNGHSNSLLHGNGLRYSYGTKITAPARQAIPKVKVISSFFYSTLFKFNPRTKTTEYNYSRVKRWTRRFDVFEYDLMLIPINQQNVHWTLGVINFKDKSVSHLDSMGKGGSPEVRENLLRWVRDEAATKGHEYRAEDWSADDVIVPQQTNSDDCGVFLCKYADFLCRGWSGFTFSQDHMNYFRARMAHELLMKKA